MSNSEDVRLMHRIVSGLSGWITFQQAAASRENYSEYFFYYPIHLIASSRGWNVRQQVQLKRYPNNEEEMPIEDSEIKGSNKSVDFVFYQNGDRADDRRLIFMEVKYIKDFGAGAQLQKLRYDLEKMKMADVQAVRFNRSIMGHGDPMRYLLIVGMNSAYEYIIDSATKSEPKLKEMIERGYRGAIDKRGDRKGKGKARGIYVADAKNYFRSSLQWTISAYGPNAWSSALG